MQLLVGADAGAAGPAGLLSSPGVGQVSVLLAAVVAAGVAAQLAADG
jgi:hypothetical protein